MSKADNKIRIIDLLNKIANGEIEDKQKFRVYFKNGLTRDIYYKKIYGKNISSLCNWYDNYTFQDEYDLDDEVEILEDNTEEIEELGVDENGFIHTNNASWKGRKLDVAFADKINELVKAVNSIRKDLNK